MAVLLLLRTGVHVGTRETRLVMPAEVKHEVPPQRELFLLRVLDGLEPAARGGNENDAYF